MDDIKLTPTTNESKIVVSTKTTDGAQNSSEETVKVRRFDGQPAVVTLTLGATVATGEFQYARVDVGVYIPCAPTKEEIEKTYEEARAFASERIKREISSIKEKMNSQTPPKTGVLVEGAPLDF